MRKFSLLFIAVILISMVSCKQNNINKNNPSLSNYSKSTISSNYTSNHKVTPWENDEVGSKKWFLDKYIYEIDATNPFYPSDPYDPSKYPLNTNFITPDCIVAYTFDRYSYSDFDVFKYLDKKSSQFVVPQDLVEKEMKKYFDLTGYDRTKCKFYSAEEKAYTCCVGGYGYAEIVTIDQINKLDNNKIEIKTSNSNSEGKLGSKLTFIMQGSGDNYIFLTGVITEMHYP